MFTSAAPAPSPATNDNEALVLRAGSVLPFRRKAHRAPARQRIYAIGDIHGRADLLKALLYKIGADALDCQAAQTTLVFLGDYIDRGPQSRQVIEHILKLREAGHDLRVLRGNHEAALLDFLSRPETGKHWLALGGAETLYSYGIRAPGRDASPRDLQYAALELNAALPASHLQFLRELETYVQLGDYLFVHAGLRPGRTLAKQTETDLINIREPFLNSRARWPYTVVHGHSPAPEPAQKRGRISLDTGAYATGRLSAVRLEDAEVGFLTT